MTLKMETSYTVGAKNLHLVLADITEMHVDAIVNAANEYLILGAGVAGAINRKGGPAIQEECNQLGGTYVGGAVITTGGRLSAKYVIHAVGPRMGEGDEDIKLAAATKNSLLCAQEKELSSIAFPAISTGIFGYPADRCANIMLGEVIKFLGRESNLTDIYFCLWEEQVYKIFKEQAGALF